MDHLDETAMNSEEFADLHEAIADGDLESVRLAVESHEEELFFSFEETSALYKAFQCKNYEIISFLIHKGAKFVNSEDQYVYDFGIDLERLNHLLLQYNQKTDKSCIYRLISYSQSPQVLDGERLTAVMSMYEEFYKSNIIKLLMRVLEREPFDIVYDFQSEKVNRMHRLYEEEAEIFGLTLSISKEIFVGAKNLLSRDQRKRAKVYGVVAEELCHLAMTTVFKNNAKPYREEDSKLIQEFHDIVLAVKALTVRSCHVASVIPDVFEYYGTYAWECELIARIPHIIGIYGEDEGRKIFQESSELYSLLKFYEYNVHEKYKLYTDPSINTKPHREMERIVTKDFISFKEKQIRPLNEDFQSFRKYLVEWESIFVITTNCTRLCVLHVYHELKREYDHLVEKKCLFFSRKCFEKNIYTIRDTMKGNLWEYLVLVMDKRELNLSRFQAEYLDHLEDFTSNGMKLIMISSTQSTDHEFDFQRAVNYKWSDLSEEYKTILQCITYLFKGEEEVTYIGKDYFSKVFNEDDISLIISSELIEVDDGSELFSQGYIADTYIERKFYSTVVDENIFKNLSPDTSIILYCLNSCQLRGMPFDKNLVQLLRGSDDDIDSDKSIFIIDRPIIMEDFTRKTSGKKFIWLDYDDKEFYLRNLSSSADVPSRYLRQKSLSEEEMLNFLKRKRIVIISDNAGYGKSTVISSLIDCVKRSVYRSWNWRVNFNRFSGNKTNPLSLVHIEETSSDEEVLNHLFRMLGLKNGLERHLFWEFSKEGRCFIFFDGLDEIPSDYVSNALKLLSTVRKQTAVNIVISTRKHHQEELEQVLDTYSHELVPLSRKDQVRYLERLWKSKLKYPCGKGTETFLNDKRRVSEKISKIVAESKQGTKNLDREMKDVILALEEIDIRDNLGSIRVMIDDLKLSSLAETVINRTSLDKNLLEFMGIPLHLFMVGVIYFDSNFNAEINSDVYSIYSKFVDQKVLIFVEEKQGWLCAGPLKERTLRNERRNAYRIHMELANQLMVDGKIDRDMKEEDLELCTGLGIVFISGAEIDFLHYTFAEFFKAESFRLNMSGIVKSATVILVFSYVNPHWETNWGPHSWQSGRSLVNTYKYLFYNMLFGNKYHEVRKFLSSALEKQKFENVPKEFFGDVDFLTFVLVQFVYKYTSFYYSFYKEDRNLAGVVNILKCLLDAFERTVQEDSMDAFVVKLESEILSMREWFGVGGCLTVRMLKKLLNRGVDVKIVLGMVEFNSNPEEVVEVVSECVSILTAGEGDANVKGLLKLLQINGSIRGGLLHHALWNARADVLTNILKFSRDVLGEEHFVDSVIQSEEYRFAMIEFVILADFSRIRGLLKEVRSSFGGDIGILFDVNLKLGILERSVCNKEDSSNTFVEAIGLFAEYFGNENLKEVLLVCDSDGKYLTHRLVTQNRNAIENLNVVSNVLNDGIEMTRLLVAKDRQLRNVFHYVAANKSIDFGGVLQFCRNYLQENEVMEMLVGVDGFGVNVLHLLFRHCSFESLIRSLNLISDTLADVDCFKQSLKSRDKKLMNIFHLAAFNKNEIKISFLDLYLDDGEIKKLFIERDVTGNTCLHSGANFHSINLPFLIDYSYEKLRFDGSHFEELILAQDETGKTFLHLFAEKYCVYSKKDFDFVNVIMESLKEKLPGDLFHTLLTLTEQEGKNFLQIENRFNKQTIECFKIIVEKHLCGELLPTNENK